MPSVKPSDEMPRLMIRFPPDVKAWLKQQASRNASSQSSEVVRSIRERMDRPTGASSIQPVVPVEG